jgi:PKD repeat protein
MRLLYTILLCSLTATLLQAQTTVFSDDFDSGLSGWTLTGSWGTSTLQAFNGSNSLADSPTGNYLANVNATATTANSYDFSSVLDANCHFKVKYDIENGFDTCYVDMSINGGTSWQNISFFNGETPIATQPWQNIDLSLGGAVGSSNVKIRFRMFTDGGYEVDGIYIDSFRLTTSTVDNSPPFIVHNPLAHYEGQVDTNFRTATITDVSGVAVAELSYQVDGNTVISTIGASDTNGNDYTFTIPMQSAGSFVKYWITAADSSPQINTIQSDTFEYIAGNYVKHDNATVTFIEAFGTTSIYSGIANRMTLPGNTTITSALIRTYTDVNNPADSIEIHVWSNNNGNPGTDLITPITVFPSASINAPNIMTVLDLRPYSAQLDSLQGSVFIGYIVPQGTTYTTITSGAGNGRGRYWNGTTWTTANAAYTYHFRLVTDEALTAPTAAFSFDNSADPTVVFTDSSYNNPTTWNWNFNNEGLSTTQSPSFTFNTPGFKNVCLTVSNFVGSNQHCESITISNSAPVANFSYSNLNDPNLEFTDQSLYNPLTWFWDFGDGSFASDTNPTHTFYGAGFYDVCLAVTNTFGGDTTCYEIAINNELPVSDFNYNLTTNNFVLFSDQSSASPNAWKWHFGTGDSSSAENPTYQFPAAGGDFEVCLTASNQYGSGLPFCDTLDMPDLIGIEELTAQGITVGPNPTVDVLNIQNKTNFENAEIQLMTIEGKVVKNTFANGVQNVRLNTADLSSGVYILKIKADNQFTISTPVVVNK